MNSNAFNAVGKNLAIITVVGLGSLLLVKNNVRSKKAEKFQPSAKVSETQENTDYYSNLAEVKPGFPLPDEEQGVKKEKYQRKSIYEGAGNSYSSRKSGDRLGFLDRRSKD